MPPASKADPRLFASGELLEAARDGSCYRSRASYFSYDRVVVGFRRGDLFLALAAEERVEHGWNNFVHSLMYTYGVTPTLNLSTGVPMTFVRNMADPTEALVRSSGDPR